MEFDPGNSLPVATLGVPNRFCIRGIFCRRIEDEPVPVRLDPRSDISCAIWVIDEESNVYRVDDLLRDIETVPAKSLAPKDTNKSQLLKAAVFNVVSRGGMNFLFDAPSTGGGLPAVSTHRQLDRSSEKKVDQVSGLNAPAHLIPPLSNILPGFLDVLLVKKKKDEE